ncbi:MAG TPA: FHA domain-containing protein [Tepidisphaeraceae bacterium]|nr:FHA domain-containing protein [Tepidisphaeraceae bacterium]
MSNNPITISWDELKTRKVDQRLSEQQALGRNRAYAQLDAEALPVATPTRGSLLNHTIFCMVALGLFGGLLAWGCGFLVQVQSAEQQATELLRGIHRIELQRDAGTISKQQADASIDLIRRQGYSNAYFAVLSNPLLSDQQRSTQLGEIQRRATLKRIAMHVLSFGLSGMLLALCLGIAEPLTERNLPALVRNGALGAGLGLIGGVVVSLFVDKLYRAVSGGAVPDPDHYTTRDILARAIAWGVLGLFLTAGSGLLMANFKKLTIGLIAGILGGAIGGALFDPVGYYAGPEISRLVALLAIGVVTGAATGLIENAAKTGWLRVTAGLIAGKQFILYRNPTYIGSSPDCQIYLFRDAKVGKRHAALHLVPGGIELEDLPLGTPTLVNGAAVSRSRLRNGDRISIGTTQFLFQQKVRG